MDMIFIPGMTTKGEVTEVSGRGVGMDAVKVEILKLEGKISVYSKIMRGQNLLLNFLF